MNWAAAASDSLHYGREQAHAVPAPESQVALGRSLLFLPLLASLAWVATAGAVWLVSRILL